MDRATLDRATLDQLRKEARSYGLPINGNRAEIIDLIMSHLERHGPTDMVEEASAGVGAESPAAAGAIRSSEPLTAEMFQETMLQMQQQMLAQQQFMAQILKHLTRSDEARSEINGGTATGAGGIEDAEPIEQAMAGRRASPATDNGVERVDRFTDVNATKWLATQIPEFGGSDSENVQGWIRRVDRVAQIHGASDKVILMAATSKLTNFAKEWYELQEDLVMESWANFKPELAEIFERHMPFYRAMQQIEARRWNPAKETFNQYTLVKLMLIKRLDLPVKDTIHLLIDGIPSSSVKAAALSVADSTLEGFIAKMRNISVGCDVPEKKNVLVSSAKKSKNYNCRNCGKPGHSHQACRNTLTCFYCKKIGHRQYDCPALSDRARKPYTHQQVNPTAAAVKEEDS